MKKQVAIASGVAAVLGLAFAAISVGEEKRGYEPLIDREVLHKAVEPATAVQARAAMRPRRPRRGPKVSYFVASSPTSVPAGGAADITVLTCPAGRKAIAGYYLTSGGIALDWFASGNTARKWEYGFMDLTGSGGEAFEGIVCMTKI